MESEDELIALDKIAQADPVVFKFDCHVVEVELAIISQENLRVGSFDCEELSCLVDFKVFNSNIAHGAFSEFLDLFGFSLECELIFFDALTPAFLNHQVFLIDKEANQQEGRGEQLHVAKNFYAECVIRWNVRLIEVGSIWSEYFGISILPDDQKSYSNGQHRREVSNLIYDRRRQFDDLPFHFFKMVHFIDETGNCLENAQNFVLLSFTLDCAHEFILGARREIATLRLYNEEDDLNVTIDVDFNATCVLLKETVGLVIAFEACESLSVSLADIT